MAKVFPKVSKCTFHRYGPSGTIGNHDGLCILPINIINEKEYYKQLSKYLFNICLTYNINRMFVSLFACFYQMNRANHLTNVVLLEK